MSKCCFHIDDTWLTWCFIKLGIGINQVNNNKYNWNNLLDIPNTDKHPKWRELNKDTNRQALTKMALRILK